MSDDGRRSRSRSPARREEQDRDRARDRDERSRSRSADPDRDRRRRSPPPRDRDRDRDRERDDRERDRRRRSPSPYRRRRSPSPYYRRDSPPRRYSRSPPRGGRGGWSPPRARSPPRPGCQLFVAGFNFIANERDVAHKFGKYGRVRDVRIVRGPQGESRGFGFVDMDTPEDAKEVIHYMNQAEWNGRKLLVEVAKRPR